MSAAEDRERQRAIAAMNEAMGLDADPVERARIHRNGTRAVFPTISKAEAKRVLERNERNGR